MSEPLLTVLKFAVLFLLYLFFFRVLRAVWAEVKSPAVQGAGAPAQPSTDNNIPAPPPLVPVRDDRPVQLQTRPIAGQLILTGPPHRVGTALEIGTLLTIGRAQGSGFLIDDDDFISQNHAKVVMQGHQVVVEDLGSTNGTFVNGERISTPTVLVPGDQLQVGNTSMELN